MYCYRTVKNCVLSRCSDRTEFDTNFGVGFGTESFDRLYTKMEQKSVDADKTKETVLEFENVRLQNSFQLS